MKNFLIQTGRIDIEDIDLTIYYCPQTNTYIALETSFVESTTVQEPIKLPYDDEDYYFHEDFE